MKTRLFILLSVLFFNTANAQQVIVKGYVPNNPDKLVRIIKYADQFSHFQETVSSTRTAANGSFKLQFQLNKTTYAFFALSLKKSELYLTPGSTYVLNIVIDSTTYKGSIFDKDEKPLPIEVVSASDSLNNYISLFNKMYDNFLYNNFNAIYKWRNQNVITNFKKLVKDTFPADVPAYFKQYVEYTIVSLSWLSHSLDNKKILKKYFIDKPVLYNNIAYTDFFHEFFKGYFESPLRKDIDFENLKILIDKNPKYEIFDKVIKSDTLLSKDEQIRELVEMETLESLYYDKEVLRNNVEKLFADIATYSKYPQNKIVALDYLKRLNHLSYGSPAPDFHLPDMYGNERSLNYYKGKFILLTFLDTGCKICNKQLEDIDKINRKFSPRLQTVSIFSGKNPSTTVRYFAKHNYQWPLLLLGQEITILEAYDIRAFPAYVLLNPDGTVALAPAPMPNENLSLFIQQSIKRFDMRK